MRSTSFARLVAVTAAGVMFAASSGSAGGAVPAPDGSTTPSRKLTTEATATKNSAPVITGQARNSVTAGSAYEFQPRASDADGDKITFTIINKPTWAAFDPATGRLSGTPAAAHVGLYANVLVSAYDGQLASALRPFSITVAKGVAPEATTNSAPLIAGSPKTSVKVNLAYAFRPTATDADGDKLTFTIVNMPVWARFDPATGRLSGRPRAADIGLHVNVLIAAADGTSSSALPPFNINVKGVVVVTDEPTNVAPVITGNPPISVKAYTSYEFQPTATDADGDTLSFTIANKPAWSAFHPATGRLSGNPAAADVGIYANVRISASDGKASSALPAFSITVAAGPAGTGLDKDADFQARVTASKAWYVNNFGDYDTIEEALLGNGTKPGADPTMEGRRNLNSDPAFALSGDRSLKLTITPTGKQAGKFRVFFHKHAPPSPQKDGDSVREFYLQYAIYWTRQAQAWTHRDAQEGEAYKTLLLEGYGPGQVMPGMSRRIPVVRASVNGQNGCARGVKTARGGEYSFSQSALADPDVVLTADSRLEDYIAKHGLTSSVRQDSAWGYVSPTTDWSHKGRWETGGDWTRNLIDHPDRGHPYGGWGWPELKKPADHTPWVSDGWTVVEIHVKQDTTPVGYKDDGSPMYGPSTFRIWAAPYGEAPRLVIDSESARCDLKYNATYYQWFELLLYDTNIVESGGFGAKVDARTFAPTATQFELIYESAADSRGDRSFEHTAISNPADKTLGHDHEFTGNTIGWNTGSHKDQVMTIVDSHYMGLVQDGVDEKGVPVMKHKTRLTVAPMAVPPVGGVGSATGFGTVGNYLQVQTWSEAGYRPPLDIYYDELLMSYGPIPFPGHLAKPLPQPAP
jgi:hypothetical protein